MSDEDFSEYVIDPTTTDTNYMANKEEFVDVIGEGFETLAIDVDDWETIRLLKGPDVSHFSPTGDYDETYVFVNVYLKDGTMLNTVRSNRDGFHVHRIALHRAMFRNPQNPKIYKIVGGGFLQRTRQIPKSGTLGRRRKVKRRRTKRKLRIPKRKGK